MATKPTTLPQWATSGDRVEPAASKKAQGWVGGVGGDRPPAQWWNWLLHLIYLWLQYVDENAVVIDDVGQVVDGVKTFAKELVHGHAYKLRQVKNDALGHDIWECKDVSLKNPDNGALMTFDYAVSKNGYFSGPLWVYTPSTDTGRISVWAYRDAEDGGIFEAYFVSGSHSPGATPPYTDFTCVHYAKRVPGSERVTIHRVNDPTDDYDVANRRYVRGGTDPRTANLNMGTRRITGLGAPAASSDAATRQYVDDNVLSGGATKVYVDGQDEYYDGLAQGYASTQAGQAEQNAKDYADGQDAVHSGQDRGYTDTEVAGAKTHAETYAKGFTDPRTANLNMGSKRITNLANPSATSDAARLSTVRGDTGARTAALNMGGRKINSLDNPSVDDDAATKEYVDDQDVALRSTVTSDRNAALASILNGFKLVETVSGTTTVGGNAARTINLSTGGTHRFYLISAWMTSHPSTALRLEGGAHSPDAGDAFKQETYISIHRKGPGYADQLAIRNHGATGKTIEYRVWCFEEDT